MLQYTNGFQGLSNEEKESIILKFVQNDPSIINEDGDLDFDTHEVASLIMDYDCAIELLKYLVGVLANKMPTEEDIEDNEDE